MSRLDPIAVTSRLGAFAERAKAAREARLREEQAVARSEIGKLALIAHEAAELRRELGLSLTALDGWGGLSLREAVLAEEAPSTCEADSLHKYLTAITAKVTQRLADIKEEVRRL